MTSQRSLLALQDLDTFVDQARYRRSHLPESVALKAVNEALATLDAEAARLTAQRQELAAQQDGQEADISRIVAKQVDLTAKLKKSSVPKEAEALQHEMATLGDLRRTIEDAELEVMELLEPIEARLAELAATRADLVESRDAHVDALASATANIDAELGDLTGRRNEAAAGLAVDTLARYDKHRSHLGGVAIARIEHGVCGGCHVKLAQTFLERVRGSLPDVEHECDECGRILVLP